MADILEPSFLDVTGIMLHKSQQKIPKHKMMETNVYVRYPVFKKKGKAKKKRKKKSFANWETFLGSRFSNKWL